MIMPGLLMRCAKSAQPDEFTVYGQTAGGGCPSSESAGRHAALSRESGRKASPVRKTALFRDFVYGCPAHHKRLKGEADPAPVAVIMPCKSGRHLKAPCEVRLGHVKLLRHREAGLRFHDVAVEMVKDLGDVKLAFSPAPAKATARAFSPAAA